MVDFGVEVASAEDEARWHADWLARRGEEWRRQGLADDDVAGHVERLDRMRAEAAQHPVWTLRTTGPAGEEVVGLVAAGSRTDPASPRAFVYDIWVGPQWRRHGAGSAARAHVEDWARANGLPRVATTIDPNDPAQSALFGAYTVTAQRMQRTLTDAPPPELPEGLAGRAMTEAEFPAWREGSVAGYAEEIAVGRALSPEEALTQANAEFDELLPDGPATENHSILVLETGDEPPGSTYSAEIWVRHHLDAGRAFVFGVSVVPELRGRGLGRAVMHLGERAVLAAGDPVLALNVFGPNTTAINLYTSLGYRITDQSRVRELTD
ncbi:Acetyltransferase (GNAT) family protein [Actinopolymorpha cephalotaxi]|uniref:Acetyltransferase (GNAT) family protein n=1 Tax=Actinopolymorpha cephalotaxi TaxID=504797 RepID=A0A1I2MCP5_9ACTN|nr:GNAT family N-acetyltransferase [Actinopolymorpha cephalotaxi]NYH81669.1 ribosomal protein S18 acetylase RimI-like enzyme [Actinopolymorpha cephalotaxi]SFF88700.1 Acetyltransferase (GNAT) family protein [Actinopolymorpha cephalotaxi]